MKQSEARLDGMRALALAAGLGVAVFLSGYAFPVYTDQARASALKRDACDAAGLIPGWHEELAALETLRHPLMQGGLSLLLAAITLLMLRRLFAGGGGAGWQTPGGRGTFLALGIGVLGLSWLSQMVSLMIDQHRGEFAWCADTIAIPMAALTTAYLLLSVVSLIVGGGLTLVMRDLPQPLGAWRGDRAAASVALSLPFALIGGLIAVAGIYDAAGSAFIGTPALVMALYLVEAARSAVIARLA